MGSSKCFCVNPKKAACGVKSYKDGFQKMCLNHSITLLQQSSDKRDAQLFRYFCYRYSIEKFQIYKKRAFHSNNAHYLKPYMGSSVYRDQKLQCVEEYKYTQLLKCMQSLKCFSK